MYILYFYINKLTVNHKPKIMATVCLGYLLTIIYTVGGGRGSAVAHCLTENVMDCGFNIYLGK